MSLEKWDEIEEDFLFTDISPEFTQEGEKTINEYFTEEIAKADEVDISVAYCSGDSLLELDRLVEERKIKRICLIIGMYFLLASQRDCIDWFWELIKSELEKE